MSDHHYTTPSVVYLGQAYTGKDSQSAPKATGTISSAAANR